MGDEVKYQQRWEFRRKSNDCDSSSNDSKSSCEPLLKKHKLVSSFISIDDEDTRDTTGLREPDKNNHDIGEQVPVVRARQRKRRNKKGNLENNEMRKVSNKEVHKKKRKSGVYNPALVDDVRIFMESLIEDLKVAREDLFARMRDEMQKLAKDEVVSGPERKKVSRGRGKKKITSSMKELVRSQNKRTSKDQSKSEKNVEAEHQNNPNELVQVQHQSELEATVYVDQQSNFKSGMKPQTCKGDSLERLEPNSCLEAQVNRADNVQVPKSMPSTGNEKAEKPASSVKTKAQLSRYDQNIQMQHQNTVVLGIRAPNFNLKSSERSKGKVTTASDNHYQAFRSTTSTKMDKAENLVSSLQPNLLSDSSAQLASSMYLTLPTVLTKPRSENNMIGISTYNYVQQKASGNLMNAYSEKQRYISGTDPEGSLGHLAQMESRMMGHFDNSSSGSVFPVPLHQSMKGKFNVPSQIYSGNLDREKSNRSLGVGINGGGIRFSGGSNALLENSNFCSNLNYKGDDRFMACQIPNIKDGGLFPN